MLMRQLFTYQLNPEVYFDTEMPGFGAARKDMYAQNFTGKIAKNIFFFSNKS